MLYFHFYESIALKCFTKLIIVTSLVVSEYLAEFLPLIWNYRPELNFLLPIVLLLSPVHQHFDTNAAQALSLTDDVLSVVTSAFRALISSVLPDTLILSSLSADIHLSTCSVQQLSVCIHLVFNEEVCASLHFVALTLFQVFTLCEINTWFTLVIRDDRWSFSWGLKHEYVVNVCKCNTSSGQKLCLIYFHVSLQRQAL